MDTARIKELAKKQGKSLSYICQLINRKVYYLNDLKKSSEMMRESDLKIIADDLNTTPEYLKGETDIKEKPTTETDDGLSQEFKSLYCQLTPEQREIVLAAMREFAKEK